MRVLILGGDGYLGWPTAMYLSARGHDVATCDNMMKRYWESEVGVSPLEMVPTLQARIRKWKEVSNNQIKLFVGDIARNARFFYQMMEQFKPDAVVHYAEHPSAPFSMIDRDKCVETQFNNVTGTLNVLFAVRSIEFSKPFSVSPPMNADVGWVCAVTGQTLVDPSGKPLQLSTQGRSIQWVSKPSIEVSLK